MFVIVSISGPHPSLPALNTDFGRVYNVIFFSDESIQPLLVVAISLTVKPLSVPVWLSGTVNVGWLVELFLVIVLLYITFHDHADILGEADVVLVVVILFGEQKPVPPKVKVGAGCGFTTTAIVIVSIQELVPVTVSFAKYVPDAA